MTEWLCRLARTTKVRCSNLGITRTSHYRLFRLGSPGRCLLITCDIHRPFKTVFGRHPIPKGGIFFFQRRTCIPHVLPYIYCLPQLFQPMGSMICVGKKNQQDSLIISRNYLLHQIAQKKPQMIFFFLIALTHISSLF